MVTKCICPQGSRRRYQGYRQRANGTISLPIWWLTRRDSPYGFIPTNKRGQQHEEMGLPISRFCQRDDICQWSFKQAMVFNENRLPSVAHRVTGIEGIWERRYCPYHGFWGKRRLELVALAVSSSSASLAGQHGKPPIVHTLAIYGISSNHADLAKTSRASKFLQATNLFLADDNKRIRKGVQSPMPFHWA